MTDVAPISLERAHRLTEAGLNLIQQALTIYDQNLNLAICNNRFGDLFDLPQHLVTPGASFEETIRFLVERGEYGPVEDPSEFVDARVNLAKAFDAHYLERTRSDGTTISIEGSPLQQGGWVTVYTDISETKHQEELLHAHSDRLSSELGLRSKVLASTNRKLESTVKTLEHTRRELISSEARARLTSEMIPAHVAHLNLKRRYTYSNGRLSTVLPGRPDDIVGMHISNVLGSNFGAVADPLEEAYRGKPSTFEMTSPDTNVRIRVSFTPDVDAGGKTSGVYIMSMNITEETQTRAALDQSHKRELAAQLTNGLAHDFGNLLTIILGLQSRLSKRSDLAEDVMETVKTTRAAALRGGVLLEKLANISGPRELVQTPTSIATVLETTKALAQPLLPANVTMEIETVDIDGAVFVDAGSLTDSLINLVLNARDALGTEGGAISMQASTMGTQWVSIRVVDDGPGFSNTSLKHALEPFYSTKKKSDGSGLGLPMAWDFAQLSGGHLTIENGTDNERERGAIVTLLFPLRRAELDQRQHFVLVVEDDLDILETTRTMLHDKGHRVLEASSVSEAHQLLQIPDIDVILTDVNLGDGETGMSLVKPGAVYTTLFMTSLSTSDPARRKAEALAPALSKPFSSEELSIFLSENVK